MDESLTDYNEAMSKFQERFANSELGGSTPEYQTEHIFAAATDGKTQIRYLIGDDAIQNYDMRVEVGDDAFIAGMKERMFA